GVRTFTPAQLAFCSDTARPAAGVRGIATIHTHITIKRDVLILIGGLSNLLARRAGTDRIVERQRGWIHARCDRCAVPDERRGTGRRYWRFRRRRAVSQARG